MARSSLLGTESAPAEPAGRDTATLGPSDSSDSGSDMAGLDTLDDGDQTLPVDVALRDDGQHRFLQADAFSGSGSDASGTGERRSAVEDGGLREAADIGTDRIVDSPDEDAGEFGTSGEDGDEDEDGASDDEDADLAFVDEAQAGDVLEDEDPTDGEDGEDGDEESDEAEAASATSAVPQTRAHTPPQPPVPRDPIDPDKMAPGDPDDDEDASEDEPGDTERHRPGRS